MHKPRLPHRLGAHRYAVISLFRALLTKTRQLDAGEESKTALQNVIRRKFRENRNTLGRFRLAAAFNNGFKALDALDAAAAGDASGISRVQNFLSTVPTRLKVPIPPRPVPPKKEPKPELSESRGSIFDRPFPSVPGRLRRVPSFVVTGMGVPFLRYKKPQPESHSGYLRKHQRKVQRWHNTLQGLQQQTGKIADLEDEWDQLVDAELVSAHNEPLILDGAEKSWRNDLQVHGIGPLFEWIGADTKKQAARTSRLLQIWEEEMRLAKAERAELERTQQAAP